MISCAVWFLLQFGICVQAGERALPLLCCTFALSRSLAAIGVVSLTMARKEGSVTTLHEGSRKRAVLLSSGIYLIILAGFMIWMGGALAAVPLAASVLPLFFISKNAENISGELPEISRAILLHFVS